jgi:uncharacterized RmlC-like cupin family protein
MSKSVEFYPIEPLYKKENGLYVQEIDRTDLPLGFKPKVRHLVTIPPGVTSANHRHPRTEGFIGVGDNLTFYWLDEHGTRKSENMVPEGEHLLFVVPPNVPHAIVNNSDAPAVLLEYADKPQIDSDIDIVKVI